MVDEIWILERLFDKIIIARQVYKEFKRPSGNNRFIQLNKLIKKRFVEIKTLQINTKEHYTYKQILNGDITGSAAGKGESATLSLAIHDNGVIAGDC